VGADNVVVQEPTMGAEDFAYMLQAKPGAYCFIANGDGAHREHGPRRRPCMLHNPSYDFNDDLIPLGATYWVRLAQPGWRSVAPAPAAGREGEALAMDVARDGPPDADKLLIVSSACHGVEGFCGSGVQVYALHDQNGARRRMRRVWRCSTCMRSTRTAFRTCAVSRTKTWT
jgi:hypothetical protein